MDARRILPAALIAVFLSLGGAHAQTVLPPGVPDLRDPAVQAEYMPIDISYLNGDPDFPLVVLARRDEGSPQFLALVIDARNGKETWSLREDRAVFYILFVDRTTIQRAFLDEGFAARGEPSGNFIPGGPETAEVMFARLGEAYMRCRGLARLSRHFF